MWGHLTNGFLGGCTPPGPANHPNPILIINSSLSTPGLGGGTGPRWVVVW